MSSKLRDILKIPRPIQERASHQFCLKPPIAFADASGADYVAVNSDFNSVALRSFQSLRADLTYVPFKPISNLSLRPSMPRNHILVCHGEEIYFLRQGEPNIRYEMVDEMSAPISDMAWLTLDWNADMFVFADINGLIRQGCFCRIGAHRVSTLHHAHAPVTQVRVMPHDHTLVYATQEGTVGIKSLCSGRFYPKSGQFNLSRRGRSCLRKASDALVRCLPAKIIGNVLHPVTCLATYPNLKQQKILAAVGNVIYPMSLSGQKGKPIQFDYPIAHVDINEWGEIWVALQPPNERAEALIMLDSKTYARQLSFYGVKSRIVTMKCMGSNIAVIEANGHCYLLS